MKFDEFLVALGLDRRLDLAAATKAGACSIGFENKVTITIEHDQERGIAQTYCIVARAPATHRDAFFAMLLQAHLFGTATDECYFGFAPQHDDVLLFKSIPLRELNTEQAVKHLESIVNQSLRWAAYLPPLLDDWEQKVAQSAINVAHATLQVGKPIPNV